MRRCMLCGKDIKPGQLTRPIPLGVSWNENEPYYNLCEGIHHESCLRMHPWYDELIERILFIEKHPRPGECVRCGQQLTKEDEYLGLGFLTNDPLHVLYKYNYSSFHKYHLQEREFVLELYDQLINLIETDNFQSDDMDYFLDQLWEVMHPGTRRPGWNPGIYDNIYDI